MSALPWCGLGRIRTPAISSIRLKVTNCGWTEAFLTPGMTSKCHTELGLTWINRFVFVALEQKVVLLKQELSSFRNDGNSKLWCDP